MKKSYAAGLLLLTSALLLPQLTLAEKERSQYEKILYAEKHACPANGRFVTHCPGFVIDHFVPLACGGLDRASNMRWQSVKDGKAKDKWERKQCAVLKQIEDANGGQAPQSGYVNGPTQ